MKYKDNYFDSGKEYNSRNILYRIKNSLFSNKLTDEHYKLLLLNKWRLLKGCKEILDAGCGKCEFLGLNPYKTKISGIDLIDDVLKQAKKKGFNVKQADVTKKLPFKKDSFDGLNFSHVLEHLDNPIPTILEFKRVLKNKGRILITVPNFSFKSFYNDYTHKRPYTKLALYRLLRDCGFENIRIEHGPKLSKIISTLFFFSPRLRFVIEKLFGKISPSEFMAIALNKK